MNYQLIFHPVADKEYHEAYRWYEERLEGLGDRFTQAIEDQLNIVTSSPSIYSKKKGNFREAKVDTFPYLIIYKVRDKEKLIFISAIYHTSRNPKKKYRK